MKNLNEYIDHTLLKATATEEQIKKLCEEAKQYKFCSVCVNPVNVKLCKNELKNTDIKVCTVIGFPLGQVETDTKAYQIEKAKPFVDEVDVVINVAKIIEKDDNYLNAELRALRNISADLILKIIIETAYLNDEQIAYISKLCEENKVDFVKTSTGFASRGASLNDIRIIKDSLKGATQIKASGGIKTLQDALSFIEAGATRIGTSSGVSIMEEYNKKQK